MQRPLGTSAKPSLLKPKCKARFRQLFGEANTQDADTAPSSPGSLPEQVSVPLTILPPLADPRRVQYSQAVLQMATDRASRAIGDTEFIFDTVHEGSSDPYMRAAKEQLDDLMNTIRESQMDFACNGGQMMESFPDKAAQMIELVQHLDAAFRAICIKLEQIAHWEKRKSTRQGGEEQPGTT